MKQQQQKLIAEPSKKGEQAKQQLILAAFDLFSMYGIDGTSTRQIAKQAKQNISAIAYYFNSKEGLYLAATEWLADFISKQFSPLLSEVDRFLASKPDFASEHEQALEYIRKISRLHCQLLTNPETLRFTRFILREQLSPTGALTILMQKAFVPLHTRLTELVTCFIGNKDNEITNMLHAQVIIGNVLAFRMGHELILARTQWTSMTKKHITMIEDVVIEQIEFALYGLRNKSIQGRSAPCQE